MHVHGEGPVPCSLYICGEGPGYVEDREGRPFIGPTGAELNRFLNGMDVPERREWFIDNLFRNYKGKDYEWTLADVRADEAELRRNLDRVNPDLVVTLGRWSTRWFLGDVSIEDVQGIPYEVEICDDCGQPYQTDKDSPERLLAVGRKAETGRIRESAHLLQREMLEGASSNIPNVSRKTTNRGSGPSVQQHVVSQSLASRSSNSAGEYSKSLSRQTNTLCKRAPSDQLLSEKESQSSRVPGVQEGDKTSILGERERSAQCCTSCGSTRFRKLVVFGIVHPAAGFHSPEMSALTVDGFRQLAAFFNGQLTPRKLYDDPFAGKEVYEEITSEEQLDAALASLKVGQHLGIDTEGWPGNPWSLQFSREPGRGYLIRASRRELLKRFNDRINQIQPRLVFHASLHDLGVGRELELNLERFAFDDTMIMAYLLGIEPKGLKSLCLRHANMKMQSFTEVMGDASRRVADTYLTWLWDGEEEKYEQRQLLEFEAKRAAGKRIKVLPKLPRTDLQKAVQRCLGAKDPRANWENQRSGIREAGEATLGSMPQATLSHIPRKSAIRYGCRDADGTIRVSSALRERIDALQLGDVYDLELATYPLIDRMQRIGLKPDLAQFSRLSERLAGELRRIGDDLKGATNREDFNPNSSHHVREFLFQRNGLESVQLTDSGDESTNDKVLEALEHEHPEIPAISAIREYREVYKLKSTFVDSIPAFVNRYPFDGRVHTSFRTTVIPTGRLAASDPNVLAQPEHGKFAKDFKRGWICDEGHVICAWDQSQIELRGLAHLSQDPLMLAVFRGERRNPDGSQIDLHAALAERIFGVKPKDQDKHKHRLPAKAINFGIPMGMTCVGLSVELRKNGVDADEETAQRWLDETLTLYTGVSRYMDNRIAEARRNGFVRCLSGRIRYIGGIRSRDQRVRAEAERFAFSTPIQESAQYIMKQAEAQVWNHILIPWWKAGRWVEPLVQIHDCLKMETEIRLASTLHKEMILAMTCVPKTLSVPLAVEGEFGVNMADMEAFS